MSRSLRSERIPQDVIILYTQTGAVPDEYTSVASLECTFSRGVASGCCPGSCVGNVTHTHAAASTHTHTSCPTTAAAHTHGGNTLVTNEQVHGNPHPLIPLGLREHTHPITLDSASGGSYIMTSDDTHTHNAVNNDVSFKTLKHLKNTVTSLSLRKKTLPIFGSIIWPKSTTLPVEFIADTAYDTFFIQGKTTIGDTGGSNTHQHDTSTTAHTHNVTTGVHPHSVPVCAVGPRMGGGNRNLAVPQLQLMGAGGGVPHTHSLGSLATSPTGSPTGSGGASQSGGCHTHDDLNFEPAHHVSRLIQFNKISMRLPGLPNKTITEWEGTLGSIPSGFQLADGTNGTSDVRSKLIKFDTSGVGSPAGADAHTHTCLAHVHTSGTVPHTHPYTGTSGVQGAGGPTGSTSPSPLNASRFPHTHTAPGTSGGTNTTISLDSAGSHTHGSKDNVPSAKEIAFIERLV